MKLAYINSGRSSVFDSQVLALLRHYQKNNVFEEVILIFGYRTNADIDWLEAKDVEGIGIYYFRIFPNYPFYNQKLQKNLYNAIRSITDEFSNYYFHIRGELTSFHFKRISLKLGIDKKQLLTDVRGASLEEVKQYSNLNIMLKWYKLLNYQKALRSLKEDKNISTVSISLKKYLITSCKVSADVIQVNSCIVSPMFKYKPEIRLVLRQQLGLNESDILIVFASGGTANWQKNDLLIYFAEMGFKVLNLSKIKIEHANVITQFVPFERVSDYLSAADAAFIWRDRSIVNAVASPVKFSEYLACGLPVIHNGTVDLINTIAAQYSIDLLISDINQIGYNKVKSLIETVNREEISKIGNALFGLPNISKSYNLIYSDSMKCLNSYTRANV